MAEMVLSADYKTAVELDQRIKTTAKALAENLFELCGLFYKMSNEKLYKELGYQNFAEYCESEVGIKRVQGTKYARIGESFSDKNVQSTVHFENLGTEKLYLLAKLDEPEREEIQQNVNVEDVSVKKLKAEIERLKEQSKKNKRELSEENHELNCRCNSLVAEMNQLKDDNDKIRSAKISMESDLLSVKSNNRSLRHQLDDAEKKIADLESSPVEVAIQEDEEGKIAKALVKQLGRQLSEADQNHVNEVQKIRREYQNQINELSRQLTEMTEQAEQKEIIEKVDNTAVFDVYFKMVDKIIYSIQAHIANDIDVGNKMIYNHQINELIRRLEKCLKQ